MPWQSWSTPQTQSQHFQQGWRVFVSGNQYAPQQFYHSPYSQQYFTYPSSYQNPSPYQQSYPQQQQQQQQQQFNPYPQYLYSIPQPPQSTQHQQLQWPSNQPPPKPTQLPSQPVENPNNKVEKQVYQTEETTLPTYSISFVHDIHLRSGKILSKDSPLIEEIER